MQAPRQTNQTGIISQAAASAPAKAQEKAMRPAERLRGILDADRIRAQFNDVLKENAGAFVASIIDLFNSDTYLQQCDPAKVVMEALKAATLKLPINKQLGFAYIVPYKNNGEQVPQFQIGYKGMIQLAMRTGAYRYINADIVYQGEFKSRDKLTGAVDLNGERIGDDIVGYFAYIETLNGFQKSIYWTKDEVKRHAERYSKSYKYSSSAWSSNFNEMALKTVLRNLLSKYGIMSVEFQTALVSEVEQNTDLADAQIGAPDMSMLESANPPEGDSSEDVEQAK